MEKIDKHAVFVTSSARTGTLFFKTLFEQFPEVYSCHEPENLCVSAPLDTLRKAAQFGLRHVTLDKMRGRWGITNLSNERMAGRISVEDAAQRMIEQRRPFIESHGQNIYAESSYHYYGLLDVIPHAFNSYRIIYIVRDPRDWVRSHMNKKEWYHHKNANTWFGTRISPKTINDRTYQSAWPGMSRFEKLCWAWATINSYALATIPNSRYARMLTFEELFRRETRHSNLQDLLEFAFDWAGTDTGQTLNLTALGREKVNGSHGERFADWRHWDGAHVRSLEAICGPLMARLGYGTEDEWRESVSMSSYGLTA